MLVTVHVSYSAGEAAAIAAMLGADGIRCDIAYRHFAMQNWDLLVAIGGLKLQVAASDAQAAVGLIESSVPEAAELSLETESAAFWRVYWTLGLLGLVLSLAAYTPFPVWNHVRKWRPAAEIEGRAA